MNIAQKNITIRLLEAELALTERRLKDALRFQRDIKNGTFVNKMIAGYVDRLKYAVGRINAIPDYEERIALIKGTIVAVLEA